MGKDLFFPHPRSLTEGFHHFPDMRPIHGPARPRDKHRTCGNSATAQIAFQRFAQFPCNQNGTVFSFEADGIFTRRYRLRSNKLQFRYADAGAADCLKYQRQPFIPFLFRRCHQTYVLRFAQFFFPGEKRLFLNFQLFDP